MKGDTNPTYQALKQYRQKQPSGATHITITIPIEEVNAVADLLYTTWIKIGLNEPGKTELHRILKQLDTLNDRHTPQHH